MGNLLGKFLLKRSKREDYEQLLGQIDEQIRRYTLDLEMTKVRQKKMHIMYTLYSIVGTAAVLFYLFVFPRVLSAPLSFLIVLGLVFGLYMVKRAINWFYGRKLAGLEEELAGLREKKKLKMEEFKKKSGYYKAKRIIERFEEEGQAPPLPVHPMEASAGALPASEVSYPHTEQAMSPPLLLPLPQQPFVPMGPVQKGWMDRLVDALLGELPNQSKYALICANCHMHNGLCFPDEIETKEFICMNCSFFNKPTRVASIASTASLSSPLELEHAPMLQAGPQPSKESREQMGANEIDNANEPVDSHNSTKVSTKKTSKPVQKIDAESTFKENPSEGEETKDSSLDDTGAPSTLAGKRQRRRSRKQT